MLVKTLFQSEGRYTSGEVEIKMLPGLPQLHILGLPDAQIRECGLKIKAAIRSAGLEWPKGNQIVVSLKPAHLRKTGSGVELAIALGFLALTGQLNREVARVVEEAIVYGEVSLDGRAQAPADFSSALAAANGAKIVTGVCSSHPREGSWMSISCLSAERLEAFTSKFDWRNFWARPEHPNLELHPLEFDALCLSAYMGLNVLVCGPQGSGKSTFARALYALSAEPHPIKLRERGQYFATQTERWRPFETPHHSITPIAMIGGGIPLLPGVITRAHGGVLLMDEFLEFSVSVLEALREPIENGCIDHSRGGNHAKFPASFQMIATSNLCPCGKLRPGLNVDGTKKFCGNNLIRCRSTCARLSGPILDRFDLVIFSHDWLSLKNTQLRTFNEARDLVDKLRAFAKERGPSGQSVPEWISQFELSHRRRRSILRVARGLADLEGSARMNDAHFHEAYSKVVDPMAILGQLFA